jgi:hypothetical protein
MSAVVVGNGESRQSLDLTSLSQRHTIIGCNALHRDLVVPHLVCCDQRMVNEAIASPNNQNTTIYTRPEWANHYPQEVQRVPDLPYTGNLRQDQLWHWGSGPLALLIACVLNFETIYLVGFDLHGHDGKLNNVYKDSKNYLKASSPPVDPIYWIYQIAKIFTLYPSKLFVVLNTDEWIMPNEWIQENVVFKNICDSGVDI